MHCTYGPTLDLRRCLLRHLAAAAAGGLTGKDIGPPLQLLLPRAQKLRTPGMLLLTKPAHTHIHACMHS